VAVLIVLWFYFILKMDEADTFETLVSIRETTACNFPEERNIGKEFLRTQTARLFG
jgi:hypothetical protein